ncbi:MAG: flagellar motor protein [Burkholderiales bacterium]|nr:flagellar motor protein [Burkholderiales bacterium]
MDWASLAGILLGLTGLIGGQLMEGGHLGSLVQPAAFVIVFVGTVGAVLLQSGLISFRYGVAMAAWIFSPPPDRRAAIIEEVTNWSTVARREGLLSLERYLDAVRDPFTAKGLRMLIDGIDPYKLKEIMEAELNHYEQRQRQAAKIWEAAGGYSPTIGIIGAVLGLIHVMENLADPSKLGSGIAVAFVATIYGVGLANLIFLPIGNRLKMMVIDQVTQREMLIDAFFGIALGDNPRIIQERLDVHRK